jgi:hypothetical protein
MQMSTGDATEQFMRNELWGVQIYNIFLEAATKTKNLNY